MDEVIFWARHRDDGSLIRMVRAFRDRAIPFFGAFAVFGENEAESFRTLEAQEILIMSDEDLLKELNRVPDMMAAELEKVEPRETREELRRISRHTQKDVQTLRTKAQHQLERALGKREGPDA